MQQFIAWLLIIFPAILFVGQIISSINFPLAQRIGLQEDPKETDTLLQRAEKYVAYWDLVTMGQLPLVGILMLMNHSVWPLIAFFGGAIYFDTAGREAAKILSFKHEGIRIGSKKQQRFFFSTYLIMAFISIFVLVYSTLVMYQNLQ